VFIVIVFIDDCVLIVFFFYQRTIVTTAVRLFLIKTSFIHQCKWLTGKTCFQD